MNGVKIVSDFDIVSFFVMLAVAFYTFTKYSERSLGNRAFKRMVICATLYSAADILFCFSVNNKTGPFLESFFYSLCSFFFAAFSQSILAYTNSYIYTKEEAQKEKQRATRTLFPILAVLLLFNLKFEFLFYIDDDFALVLKKSFAIIPILTAAFAAASAMRLGRFAQKFNKPQIVALCFFFETAIVLPFAQAFVFPNFKITAFVFALLTTTLLLTIETPDDQALVSTISELEELQRALKASVEKKTFEARERLEKIERLATQMTRALAETIDAKDRYTSGHSGRVARYSKMLAKKIGLPEEKGQQIFMMGLLHDIGKVGVSTKIINKPDRLTDQEFSQMKTHPAIGSSILEKVSFMPELKAGARWHHERIDGRGYPDGLSGDMIPLEAKIIAVADAYDAMTSSRSYRLPMEQSAVKEQLRLGKGTQFDEKIADLMISLIDEDVDYNLREYKGKTEDEK